MTDPVAAGIDLGWRLLADGGLRVGYICDNAGRSEPIHLPARIVGEFHHSDDIASIRDTHFDAMRMRVAAWVVEQKELPEWVAERTESLALWKSKGRLAQLLAHWSSNRFVGDEEIHMQLSRWMERDVHLWQYERGCKKKATRQRRSFYRQFAAEISRQYHSVAIEKIDWTQLSRDPTPESNETVNRIASRNRTIAAVGELSGFLKAVGVPEAPAENTTRQCHLCDHINNWDQQILVHTCGGCGATWDQDENAAMNLLRMAEPIEKKKPKVCVYKYRGRRPATEEESINRQISLAHKYYNRLVEIRNAEVEAVRALRPELSAEIADLENQKREIGSEIERIRTAIKQRNSAMVIGGENSRGRKTGTPEDRAAIAELCQRRRDTNERLRAAQQLLASDPVYVARLVVINATGKTDRKSAYAEYGKLGVYWGTLLKIAAAVDQAQEMNRGILAFRRWNGNGLVAAQIQNGMTVDELESGHDTRVRLVPSPRFPKQRVLWMRIGSIPGSVKPLWATIPIHYHRPLPAGSKIMWVVLTRKQTAVWRRADGLYHPYYDWDVNFTIRLASGEVVDEIAGIARESESEGGEAVASEAAVRGGRWGKRKANRSRGMEETSGNQAPKSSRR